MRITLEHLRKVGACRDSINMFCELFPSGAEITIDNVGIALAAGMDLNYFISQSAGFSYWISFSVKKYNLNECYAQLMYHGRFDNPTKLQNWFQKATVFLYYQVFIEIFAYPR